MSNLGEIYANGLNCDFPNSAKFIYINQTKNRFTAYFHDFAILLNIILLYSLNRIQICCSFSYILFLRKIILIFYLISFFLPLRKPKVNYLRFLYLSSYWPL